MRMGMAPRCVFLRWRRHLPPAPAYPQTLTIPGVPAANTGTAPRETIVVRERGLAGPGSSQRSSVPINVPSAESHGLGHPLAPRGTVPWCLEIQNPGTLTWWSLRLGYPWGVPEEAPSAGLG